MLNKLSNDAPPSSVPTGDNAADDDGVSTVVPTSDRIQHQVTYDEQTRHF
jgi:hypothetical protein